MSEFDAQYRKLADPAQVHGGTQALTSSTTPVGNTSALQNTATRVGDGSVGEAVSLLDHEMEDEWQQYTQHSHRTDVAPWYAYPLLAAAVLAVSSAAVVFASMKEVPAITLAAWRLQLTTLLLLPGCIMQYRKLSPELQRACFQNAGLLCAASVSLAFHFGLWVWGVENTSLVHALLLVSCTPIVIALGTWVLGKPISTGEQVGAMVGFAGTMLLSQGAGHDSTDGGRGTESTTVLGDLSSFGACIAVIGYLVAGRILRAWMPIFVYACIVTGTAALLLCAAAMLVEKATMFAAGSDGIFGWIASDKYWYRVLYLAVFPGIVGHTGFNTVLRWLPPLVISLAMTLEPLFGSLLGWLVFGRSALGAWTVAGGSIMLVAVILTTVAHHQREEQGRLKRNASIALQRVFTET